MTRDQLIVWHQARSEEYYAFARWTAKKAKTQRPRFEWGLQNDYYPRVNQHREESATAAAHSKSARLLMGMED